MCVYAANEEGLCVVPESHTVRTVSRECGGGGGGPGPSLQAVFVCLPNHKVCK